MLTTTSHQAFRLGLLVASLVTLLAPPVTAAEPTPLEGYRTEARLGVSFLQPAANVGVAATWTCASGIQFGGLLELNPWLNVERGRPSAGSTNLGFSLGYLHPIAEGLYWRGTLAAGMAILNQDMLGSDAGTRGVFVDLRLVELLWLRPNGVAITLGAFELGLPVPQLRGLPILVPQQRLSVGVRF